MNSRKKRWWFIISMLLISFLNIFLACDGPPDAIINIDPGDAVMVGQEVTLDNYASSNAVNVFWSLISKPDGSLSELSSEDGSETKITPDTPGIYEVRLTVTNACHDSDQATMSFEAFDGGVYADAGEDIYVNVGDIVNLDGSTSLPEFQFVNVAWSIIDVPIYSEVTTESLYSPDYITDHFTMDEPGIYSVELYIELKEDNSENDRDTVLVISNPPQIQSFAPMNGPEGTEVFISGKNFSNHLDGNIVKFNENQAAEILEASDSLIKVVVPVGAITGPITVKIYETGEEVISIDDFVIGELTPTVVLSTLSYLVDISFRDLDDGLVVGDEGVIIRTQDGGETWSQQSSGTFFALHSVSFKSTAAFVVGENGTVLKSTNGGSSWNTLSSFTDSELTGVSFLNGNTGYVCGRNPVGLWMTEDGGDSWEVRTPNTNGGLDDVFFVNGLRGYTVGAYGFFYTTDGGLTWEEAQSGVNNNGLYTISFFENQKGWIAGNQGHMAKTNDGGITFGGGYVSSSLLNDVHFGNEENGIVVGYYDSILITADGGLNWVTPDMGINNHHYYAVHMFSPTSIVLVGYDLNLGQGKIILLN